MNDEPKRETNAMKTIGPVEERASERCVWMDAGVLNYKLCNHEFDCDTCLLDAVLRSEGAGTLPVTGKERFLTVAEPLPETCEEEYRSLLSQYTYIVLRENLSYTRQHLWVDVQSDRCAVLGVDMFLASLLPEHADLVVSADGAAVTKGLPFAWLYFDGKALPLLSPIDGAISRRNYRHGAAPRLLQDSPYDLGWVASLSLKERPSEADLIASSAMAEVVEMDMKRLLNKSLHTLRRAHDDLGVCLNDGGQPVASLHDALGPEAYYNLVKSILAKA